MRFLKKDAHRLTCQTPLVARTLFPSSPLAKSQKQAMYGQQAFQKSSKEVCSEQVNCVGEQKS